MNAYKVEAVIAEDGTVTLRGLPFSIGDTVEVILVERSPAPGEPSSHSEPMALDGDYLLGVEAQLSEWTSPEDEAAYSDL